MLVASPRKIRSSDAAGARRMAGTVSGVAMCQDLTVEFVV